MVVLDRYNDKIEGNEGVKTFVREGEGVNIPEMLKFPVLYWLIIGNYGLQSGAFYNFTNVANGYLVTRYGFNPVTAGTLIAFCIYGTGAVFPPMWGKLIDTFGQRVYFMLMAAMFLVGAHLGFITSHDCANECYWPVPVVPLVLLGLYISCADSLTYPSFPIFLPERKLATAFAGALVCQNIVLTVGPAIVGLILDDAPDYDVGYERASWFFLGCALAGIVVIGFLYVVDRRQGSRLQLVHEVFEVEDERDGEEERERLKGEEERGREASGVDSML